MDENKTLQIVIKAIDDASAQLNAIKTKASELNSQFGENSDGLKKYLADEKNASNANDDMTASVFKGVASWDLLKQGVSIVAGFLEQSVEASMKASEAMAIVKTNVENAGLSWTDLQPKLQAYSESMAKLGFDHEDTAKSVSKLLLITGDYNQALALNSLAMDLARNRGVSLETATTSLAQVLQGQGARALTQYGLTFKDGASSAEILMELQDKLKNSATNYAESAGGQMEVLNLQWEEMKKKIGDDLTPTFMQFVTEFEKYMPEIESLAKGTVSVVEGLATAVGYVVKSAEELGSVLGSGLTTEELNANDVTETYHQTTQKLADAYNRLHPLAKITAEDLRGVGDTGSMTTAQMKLLHESAKAYNDEQEKTDASSKKVVNALANVSGKAGTTAGDISKLKDQYKTMSDSAIADLTDLNTAHQSKMASIATSIANVQKQMSDLQKTYNQTQTSDTQSVADQIVASQTKIADIKKQLASATTQTERDNLNQQLKDEQKNLDSSADFQKNNTQAITEAQRRAGLTDLQRTIEDYNNKRALASQEFQDKMTDLNNELIAKQNEGLQETALYKAKVDSMVTIMTKAGLDFQKLSNDRVAITKTEVDTEIAYYQELQKAISAVKSATSIASVANTNNVAKVTTKKASGGSVSGDSSYLVGENGAEIFTPTGSGYITPNSQVGGGKSIVVNINGGTYLSQDVANQIGNMIIKNLQRVARI